MEEKNKIPDWLKNLQENSWELELLISGGAIFTLIQASDFFLDSVQFIRMLTAFPLTISMVVGVFGLKLLTFGFILHLLLRSFWVAMVFVNFVFPNGINQEKIKYKKPFRANIDERSDLYNPIMKVDKLAGLIMFLSITYSIVIFGLILVLLVLMPIMYSIPIVFINSILGFSFFIYVIDFFSFGFFRKIKYISYILFPFFKIFDYLSLRFLYEKSLLVYSSNINKLKTTLFMLVFMFIVFVGTYFTIQETLHWPNLLDRRDYRWSLANNPTLYDFYEDDYPNSPVTIPSKIITNNYLELTIEYWAFQDKFLEVYDKPENEKLFSDIIEVCIDDSVYTVIDWFPFKKSENRTLGIKAMLPIDNLAQGKHILTVRYVKEIQDKLLKDELFFSEKEIPFWKNNK